MLVCDAFHAMTSARPYRHALGAEAALAELRKNADSQFCPRTVEAFVDDGGPHEAGPYQSIADQEDDERGFRSSTLGITAKA